MHSHNRAPFIAALCSLALAACSPANPPVDAATQDRVDPTDTQSMPDSQAVPDAAAPDATSSDASEADATSGDATSGDASACEDFTGAYSLTGTCSVPGFSPFASACITQTGCATRVVVPPGPAAGTVVGNRMTFPSMVSGITLTCTATRGAGGTLTVHCEAPGLATCDAVATPGAFPGATRWCCDAVAQDCGVGQRCTVVGIGTNNATSVTACVPTGTLNEGDACVRADNRIGADQCSAGLACVNLGQATATSRTCQPLCRNTSDCSGGAVCQSSVDTPRAGICRPTCDLNTACSTGTCRYNNTWPAMGGESAAPVTAYTCNPTGAVTEGAACASSNDCAATLTCVRRTGADPFACRRICDAMHACPMGVTCTGMTSATNPSGAGACIP